MTPFNPRETSEDFLAGILFCAEYLTNGDQILDVRDYYTYVYTANGVEGSSFYDQKRFKELRREAIKAFSIERVRGGGHWEEITK